MSGDVIIGIPVRNDFDSFREMIISLGESTSYYKKIVIIESESTDGSKELCQMLSMFPEFEVIHTKKEGPLKAYNRLFKIAEKEKCSLLLTQTDVIFPKLYKRDWLEIMDNIAKQTKASIVIPLNGGGISGKDYIEGFYWAGGWCSFYPYETIKKVGGYDENFPNGYGVDIDHSYRCLQIGPIIRINYWVDHHMQNHRTHDKSPDAEKQKKASSKYFKKKWKLGSV